MECQRFAHATADRATFGHREAAAGMVAGLLLLGSGMMNLDLGLKWNFGCNCSERPGLAAAPLFERGRSLQSSYGLGSALSAASAPAAPARAASPLPVASSDMRGAQVGAEPEARLGALSAFPSADPWQDAGAVAAPAAQTVTPRANSTYSQAFAPAPELEAEGDELIPVRKRR